MTYAFTSSVRGSLRQARRREEVCLSSQRQELLMVNNRVRALFPRGLRLYLCSADPPSPGPSVLSGKTGAFQQPVLAGPGASLVMDVLSLDTAMEKVGECGERKAVCPFPSFKNLVKLLAKLIFTLGKFMLQKQH